MPFNQKWGLMAVLSATAMVAPVSVTSANIISANFTGGNGGPYSLSSTQVAGVGSAAVDNWNNLNNTSSTSESTPQALLDNNGNQSNATVTWSGADAWGTYGTSQTDPNLQMLNGYVDSNHHSSPVTPAVVSVSGISYSNYEVIAYFNSDHLNTASNASFGNISISGGNTYYFTAVGPVDYTSTQLSSGDEYIQATTTTDPGKAESADVADYAVFTGLTAGSFTLTATPEGVAGSGNNLGITGFQIVETPEPSSLVLGATGAVGLFGLLARRRRSCSGRH